MRLSAINQYFLEFENFEKGIGETRWLNWASICIMCVLASSFPFKLLDTEEEIGDLLNDVLLSFH